MLPELVQDGRTGFLVDDEAGFAGALARAEEIDPDDCRASVEGWTPAAMARRYVELYAKVLDRSAAARSGGR